MGDVEAFAVAGIKCYFPSADHYPQHFEAYRRGAYVVRVFFLRTNRTRGLNWEYKLQMRGSEFGAADRDALYEMGDEVQTQAASRVEPEGLPRRENVR